MLQIKNIAVKKRALKYKIKSSKKMFKIAIDLLWVKHNKIGGVESYVRNLLDGMKESSESFCLFLIVAKDNYNSFKYYETDKRFSLIRCNVNASNSVKAILWINLHLDKLVSKLNVDFCFIPNSRKPLFTNKKNWYVCTIHDLQVLHYPEYFSKIKAIYLRINWKRLIKTSHKIIAISNYVKDDIIQNYHVDGSKISVIYNPISTLKEIEPFENVANKYDITHGGYFYTVSSLLRHKNTITLLKMMNELVNKKRQKNYKLLISGIRGDHYDYLHEYIDSHILGDNCIFTGFVSDAERNTLMKYCSCFLFPSIFEGFGMPVIEALRLGAKVITTNYTSIEEVSKGKAIYVNDPFDDKEWIDKIEASKTVSNESIKFEEYDLRNIANQYIDLFKSLCRKKNNPQKG